MKHVKPKSRIVWGFNPVSRTVPSKKRFNRRREKSVWKKEL